MKVFLGTVVAGVMGVTAIATASTAAGTKNSGSEIVAPSGVRGGLVVHLGCGEGRMTADLSAGDRFVVHALDRDKGSILAARNATLAKGIYGRVSFMHLEGDELPYVDDVINLLAVEDPCGISRDEMMRVVAPLGVLMTREGGTWKRNVKPWSEDIDEWSHFMRDPQNSAVSRDQRIGQPRSLRWVAPPRWARSHDEFASMSAMVSARGRVFYIQDVAPLMSLRFPSEWKLIARDAFNGIKLWERPIPNWVYRGRGFRAGPVHLPRRLVAVGDRVFVTLGFDAPLTMLDAVTGECLKTYEGTGWTEEIMVSGGRLYLMVGSSETRRAGSSLRFDGEPAMTKDRFIKVLDVKTGREVWSRPAGSGDYVLPLSLIVRNDDAFFQTIQGVHCVDVSTGSERWMVKRPTVAKRHSWSTSTLTVSDDILLCSDRTLETEEGKALGPAKSGIEWAVETSGAPGLERGGKRTPNRLTAYSVKDGRELWSVNAGVGVYNSPVDVLVIDGEVWTSPRFRTSYDLRTGEILTTLSEKRDPVGMLHDRCYRNKATVNYLLTARDGIEVIDTEKGWLGNNSWVRGTCQYGIMPANGLIYAPPNACACHSRVKLQGINALSASLEESVLGKPASAEGRLFKGPGYGSIGNRKSEIRNQTDWPVFRADSNRSGFVKTSVADSLAKKWSADIGGRLTQPISAGGRVFVASVDAHTVYALDAESGKELWSYSAEARVDSPPTIIKGLAVFGSADGHVYAVDAVSGKLAWRFHAAPMRRFICINEQLESSWPVHGSVLVHNDELVFTAGRSSYLDGGLYFYRLDPVTGEMLATSIIASIDPVTDRQTEIERGFDSGGTLSDIMSSDGETICIKHMTFDEDGRRTEKKIAHLWSGTGFLGEEWFVRTYWLHGVMTGTGWKHWPKYQSAVTAPAAGRILAFNSEDAYGYGRRGYSHMHSHSRDQYQLFSKQFEMIMPPPQPAPPPDAPRRRRRGPPPKQVVNWTADSDMIVRAMALTDGKLVVAGVPDVMKRSGGLALENPEESLAALKGKKGAVLRVLSTEDGSLLGELKLDAMPVFDGVAAASGRLFVSLKNGELLCCE